MLAAHSNRLAVVRLLVEAGADTNLVARIARPGLDLDENGNTALDLARHRGHNDIVAYLEPLTSRCTKCGGNGDVPCGKNECPRKRGWWRCHPCPKGACRKLCPKCKGQPNSLS